MDKELTKEEKRHPIGLIGEPGPGRNIHFRRVGYLGSAPIINKFKELNLEKMAASKTQTQAAHYVHVEDGKENPKFKTTTSEDEKPVEEEKNGFGDQFDFTQLFRVKGKKGIHLMISKINKAGMVGVREFLGGIGNKTVHARDLVCLGHFTFQTLAGHDDLSISDVMNNISEIKLENEDKESMFYGFEVDLSVLKEEDLLPFMEKIVPCYDSYKFKLRHAKQVLLWYKELKQKRDDLDKNEKINTTDDSVKDKK